MYLLPAKQKTELDDWQLILSVMILNTILVSSTPPISHPSPQMSTRRPLKSDVPHSRNEAASTHLTRLHRNPEKVLSGSQIAEKYPIISAVDSLMGVIPGTRLCVPETFRRDLMTLITSSTFPVLIVRDSMCRKSQMVPLCSKIRSSMALTIFTSPFLEYPFSMRICVSRLRACPKLESNWISFDLTRAKMVFHRSPLLSNSLNNSFTLLSTDDFDGFFGSTVLDSTDGTVELTELLNWGCASSMRGGVGVWVVRNGSCMGTISFEKNSSTNSRLFWVQGKSLKPVNMRSFAILACKNTRI